MGDPDADFVHDAPYCWERREHYLEAGAEVTGETFSDEKTPAFAIAPAREGKLTLVVEWPRECTGCRLVITEHLEDAVSGMPGGYRDLDEGMFLRQSGFAGDQATQAKLTSRADFERDGSELRRDTIALAVKPGVYRIIGVVDGLNQGPFAFTLRSELVPREVSTRGVTNRRICDTSR